MARAPDPHHQEDATRSFKATELPTAAPSSSADLSLSPGQLLGNRYRVDRFLGRGGMGEVWQAFDLKLRVDVALKSVRHERFPGQQALELLRSEVRVARDVVSPNVCRIYDLEEIEEQELMSMEYIDGRTLLDLLRERSPLELREATEIASQFLAGLEAIHSAGLVHRDVKPENIMITRSGRVVLMDFGLAKPEAEEGAIAGTPAYMAPEQHRGEALDARTDIFATGIVLAEMTSAEGVKNSDSRETLQKSIHEDPPRIPDSPWRSVVERAVAGDPSERYPSASELTRALEEIALRDGGADDRNPYPGLASFTEADAEYFFGRELEVESVWRKLHESYLLALVGPSGAGKSSFVQAGLVSALPDGWGCVGCHPGEAPMASIVQALVSELARSGEDVEGAQLARNPEYAVAAFASWRRKHGEVLMLVDQFEELFTLNPPETQATVAAFLRRLALEADIHVLLSMRDDFLLHCQQQPALAPIFSELTPLNAPLGTALRRALVQPALLCGYRFEDETLVDEMLAEVAEERGALPLVAFAMAQLWERRDRERGLLTRAAYRDIGGVGGALAQHAEATLERLGAPRVPLVREIFRNLVTAEGTRASREVSELLSVFSRSDREDARGVLDALVDARLLTSFEQPLAEDEDAIARRRVEIIHESLLNAWPRLVRWRTQDADSAMLRDQMRQAARIWEERGKPTSLLWAGSAYREFVLWRERYPGGLSEIEGEFARAMSANADRQRRRRRTAIVVAFAALVAVLIVVGGLWQQSVQESRRAEGHRLLAEARLRLDDNPTVALAVSTASLELADNPEVRRFSTEALWRGPTYSAPPESWRSGRYDDRNTEFSPDGRWLVSGCVETHLYSRQGGKPQTLPGPAGLEPGETLFFDAYQFSADSDRLAAGSFTTTNARRVFVWSLSDRRLIRQIPDQDLARLTPDGQTAITFTWSANGVEFRSWPVDGVDSTLLGRLDDGEITTLPDVDASGRRLAYGRVAELFVVTLDELGWSSPRLIGRHLAPIRFRGVGFDPHGKWLAASDEGGEIRVWSVDPVREEPLHRFQTHEWARELRFDAMGSQLAAGNMEGTVAIWALDGPSAAEPLRLTGFDENVYDLDFDPSGQWLVKTGGGTASLWPLARSYPRVLRGHTDEVSTIVIEPDGKSFLSSSGDSTIRRWSLTGEGDARGEVVLSAYSPTWIAMDASGEQLVVSCPLTVFRTDDGSSREFPVPCDYNCVAISPDGRLMASGNLWVANKKPLIRVFDVESGVERALAWEVPAFVTGLHFTAGGQLLSTDLSRLRMWDLNAASAESLAAGFFLGMDLRPDERQVALITQKVLEGAYGFGTVVLHDLETGHPDTLASHGSSVTAVTYAPDGQLVATGTESGLVQVGAISGDQPHLLFGHEERINCLVFTPDGRWLISASKDATIRVWPVPTGTPIHTLPKNELMRKLRALTNLRLVPDASGETADRTGPVVPGLPSGYHLTVDTFRGWQDVPGW